MIQPRWPDMLVQATRLLGVVLLYRMARWSAARRRFAPVSPHRQRVDARQLDVLEAATVLNGSSCSQIRLLRDSIHSINSRSSSYPFTQPLRC